MVAQIFQNPLTREYTLIHSKDPLLGIKVYTLLKGFWKIWVGSPRVNSGSFYWGGGGTLDKRGRFVLRTPTLNRKP